MGHCCRPYAQPRSILIVEHVREQSALVKLGGCLRVRPKTVTWTASTQCATFVSGVMGRFWRADCCARRRPECDCALNVLRVTGAVHSRTCWLHTAPTGSARLNSESWDVWSSWAPSGGEMRVPRCEWCQSVLTGKTTGHTCPTHMSHTLHQDRYSTLQADDQCPGCITCGRWVCGWCSVWNERAMRCAWEPPGTYTRMWHRQAAGASIAAQQCLQYWATSACRI